MRAKAAVEPSRADLKRGPGTNPGWKGSSALQLHNNEEQEPSAQSAVVLVPSQLGAFSQLASTALLSQQFWAEIIRICT